VHYCGTLPQKWKTNVILHFFDTDIAFMAAIAWTAVNVLLANFPLRTSEYEMDWVSPLRWVAGGLAV